MSTMRSGGTSGSSARTAGGRARATRSKTSTGCDRMPRARPRPGAAGRDRRQPDAGTRGLGADAPLPADVITSSASLGARKPDPRFFELVVELADALLGGRVRRNRVDNDVSAGRGRARRRARAARAGKAAANAARSLARRGRARVAPGGASLARVTTARLRLAVPKPPFPLMPLLLESLGSRSVPTPLPARRPSA